MPRAGASRAARGTDLNGFCRSAGQARGCTSFHAPPSEFRSFLKACRRIGLRCAGVVASTQNRRNSSLTGESEALAVYQDLPPRSPLVASLVRDFLYPAWLRSIPLCFFSSAGEDEYSGCGGLSQYLHTDIGEIDRALAGEQLIRLVTMEMRRHSGGAANDALPECAAESQVSGAAGHGLTGCPMTAPEESLDASQTHAVNHSDGPMRVLAPAGSGKTRTIVSRIRRLVRDGVPPGSILPLAFNRKAAAEMNNRLSSMGLGGVEARTFHSLGYEIVRNEAGYIFDPGLESPVIAKQSCPMESILREAITAVYPGLTLEDPAIVHRCVRHLSATKMNLLDPDRLFLNADGNALPFGPLFRTCLRIQAERRFMNFDDMVYLALSVLLDDPSARRAWQDRSTYVLVDEFQDLNPAQLLLLRILALPRDNLFVVGDDDQAIYGWRGASVRGLLDFRRAYPSAAACILSTNYRSAGRIIAHAGWLIAANTERVPKEVLVRDGAPAGEFRVRLGMGLRDQAREAARWIGQERFGTSLRWTDFAVLYRYNAHASIVAIALDELGIPHDCGSARPLFATRAGQDVIAWLRYMLGRPASGDLTRILSRPKRILPYALACTVRSEEDLLPLLRECDPGDPRGSLLSQFCEAGTRLRSLMPALGAGEFLDALDRYAGFRSLRRRRAPVSAPDEADDATCFDVIEALANGYRSASDFLAYAEEVLASPEPVAPEDMTRDAVTLSSVHGAKGNEYSHVVFFDMSRRRRPRAAEVEEERRVAYVGLTRARDAILVTAEARRQSQFLREAALNPSLAGRMRDDIERKLRAQRRRYSRLRRNARNAPDGPDCATLRREIDLLEEELICRLALERPPS